MLDKHDFEVGRFFSSVFTDRSNLYIILVKLAAFAKTRMNFKYE